MTNPNDPVSHIPNPNSQDAHPDWGGLTKRELFAVIAMQGMIAASVGIVITAEEFAYQSVFLADTLVAALNKRGPNEKQR